MVRAILDDRKTQTRRIFHPPAPDTATCDISVQVATGEYRPRYAIGDRLWCRESFAVEYEDGRVIYRQDRAARYPRGPIFYMASNYEPERWRPSIHMPRWASRLTLTVTDVRVQRVQDISEADALAEGTEPVLVPPDGGSCPHVEGFRSLWDSLNAARGYDWETNPWVTAITFTAERRNIDAEKAA